MKIAVEVPTHVAAVLDFTSGAVGTLLMSFDVWGAHLPWIEIYGTEGSLAVPDPNTFGGPVKLLKREAKEWDDVPLQFGYTENSRGLGVAEMADAIRADRPHRANGELLYHVLDVMEGIHDVSRAGRHYRVSSTFERPALLPPGAHRRSNPLVSSGLIWAHKDLNLGPTDYESVALTN